MNISEQGFIIWYTASNIFQNLWPTYASVISRQIYLFHSNLANITDLLKCNIYFAEWCPDVNPSLPFLGD